MNIEFERTIDDIIDFNLFHMAQSSTIQRQLLSIQLFSGTLIVSLVFFILYRVFDIINLFTISISILAGFLMFALYPLLSQQATIGRIRKMLNEGNNRDLVGHQIISFSPEGIVGKSQSIESKINWSAIDRVVQSEKHFFLYTSSVNALVIPKGCFQSKKQQEDFLKYITAHIQQ